MASVDNRPDYTPLDVMDSDALATTTSEALTTSRGDYQTLPEALPELPKVEVCPLELHC